MNGQRNYNTITLQREIFLFILRKKIKDKSINRDTKFRQATFRKFIRGDSTSN